MEILENRILEELELQGRSQVWLSQKIGVTPNTVNNWCANKTQPGIIQSMRIASVLGVSINELIKKES